MYMIQEVETSQDTAKTSEDTSKTVEYLKEINEQLKELTKKQESVEKQQKAMQNSEPKEVQTVEKLEQIIIQQKETNAYLRFQNSLFCGVLGFFLICFLLYKVFFQNIFRYAI